MSEREKDLERVEPVEPVELTDEAWRARLTPERYAVCRLGATEPAFTGDLWDNHAEGTYDCAGCGLPLFTSDAKYDSGSGWPSFFRPVEPGRVGTEVDRSHGMTRTELHCARCRSHLGHLFPDGPAPTGTRFCVNSASLVFRAAGE